MEGTSSSDDLGSADGTMPMDQSAPFERYYKIRRMIDEAEEMPIEAGSVWYLLSTTWMLKWARWCKSGHYDAPMEPINNEDLVDPDNVHLSDDLVGIRPDAREGRDFRTLPEECWDLLVEWYEYIYANQLRSLIGMALLRTALLSDVEPMSMHVGRPGSRCI